MRKINFLGTAIIGSLAAISFANAADMIDEVPQAPEAVIEESAPGGWAGAYVGAYGGYGKGTFGGDVDIDADGFQGGAFAGYNLQNGGLVYGLDSDLGYGGGKGEVGTVTAKKGINGAVRARLGVDVGPALIYGAVGGAATRATASDGAVEDTNLHLGYTAGGGIDARLTDRVFARGEYRYNVYNEKSYALTAPATVDLKQHDVRVGVGLKF